MDIDLRREIARIWDMRQRDEITDEQATELMVRAREKHRAEHDAEDEEHDA